MSRTVATATARIFAHSLASAVGRQKSKPLLRLDPLENREMPGNVWQGVFLGLSGGAAMLEPLMSMSSTFGEDALLAEPPPAVPTATLSEPPAPVGSGINLDQRTFAADADDETSQRSIEVPQFGGADGWDGFASTGPEDFPDISIPDLPTSGGFPASSEGASGSSGGASVTPPPSRFAGESPSSGSESFAGNAIAGDSASDSLASSPAMDAVNQTNAVNGQSTPNVVGGTGTPILVATPAANASPATSTTQNPDADADGVPLDVESRGPNHGDGNSDGVADSLQPGVTSIPAATTGEFVVVEAPGHELRQVQAIAPSVQSVAGNRLSLGLFGFEVHGVTPGGTATVRLVLPPGAAPKAYFKQNPTTGDLERFDFDGATGAVISGNVVSLSLEDGGRGDADGIANGVIVDPGGPGSPVAPLVQTFYVPMPEDMLFTSLQAISTASANPIESYTSIAAVGDGTVIYYDQWEDGYEANLAVPIQSTTQIWGDGNTANGTAPGTSDDLINAGRVLKLYNPVTTTNMLAIDFDGGDKFATTKTLAVTRLAWPAGPGVLIAEAVEVYDVRNWGMSFRAPVGTNTNAVSNATFEYSGLMIMASQNNTTVNIDANADGVFEIVLNNVNGQWLQEGKSYLVNGTVKQGAQITSDKPIQVQLLTGDIGSTYASRWFAMLPTDQWSNNYFTPVSTTKASNPGAVYVHNPNAAPVTVSWKQGVGAASTFTVPGQSLAAVAGATQANPCQITTTAAHGFSTGDTVRITGVLGMTQLNGPVYTITVVSATTFTLNGVNSTAYGIYTSGGSVTRTGSAVTGATKTNPCAITTGSAHGLSTGDQVTFTGVGGMTQLNGNTYTVTVTGPNGFTLNGVNATSYGTYTAGTGTVVRSSTVRVLLRSAVPVTMATKATSCVITTGAAHGLLTGDRVTVGGVGGMTQLNGNTYTVTVGSATQFTLTGVNSTTYGTYTSGGSITRVGSAVSGALKTNPCQITTAGNHGLTTGDQVTFTGVGGMTQLNGPVYSVTVTSATGFTLNGVNATGYGTYTAGTGTVTRVNGPSAVSGATNANPAAITTAGAHGFSTGNRVTFNGVGGMTQLNGPVYTITVTGANTFTLNGVNSTSYGTYTTNTGTVTRVTAAVSAATQADPAAITTAAAHGLSTGDQVTFGLVGGMTQLNGPVYTITVTGASTFTLNGVNSTTFGVYTSGGAVTRVSTAVSGATRANPCAITTGVPHGLSSGDQVTFAGVGGMTQLNGNTYTVSVTSATTFTLNGIDSTAYGIYTSGGTFTRLGTGTRFWTAGSELFYAVESVDDNGSAHDWGMALLPADRLTSQVMVGLGLGRNPTDTDPANNYNPVWVTPFGNGTTATTVYVDYNGDNVGPNTDPDGFKYDVSYSLTELTSQRVLDPDGDQTGMLLYTRTSGVKLAVAWGQDPFIAPAAGSAIDAGTVTPPLPAFEAGKSASLVTDLNGDGQVGPGDTIRYDVVVHNISRVPVPNLILTDLLPPNTTYLANSTTKYSSETGTTVTIPDDAMPGTAFPLDVAGQNIGQLIPKKDFIVSFNAVIDNAATLPDSIDTLTNTANVTAFGYTAKPSVDTPLFADVMGSVFEDLNRNGTFDANEHGLANVSVQITNKFSTVQTVTTNAAGNYSLAVPAGSVTADVDNATLPANMEQTAGLDPSTITAIAGVVNSIGVDGYALVSHSLSGIVYHDADNDGVSDAGEAGLEGIVVTLTGTDTLGAVNRTAVTDFGGAYSFTGLQPGTYTAVETQPAGWTDGIDTVGTPTLGATNSVNDQLGVFTFPSAASTNSINSNFGERDVSITGTVFADSNWNGVKDTLETGLSGVAVTLKDAAGSTIATQTTIAGGTYSFGQRAPALYTVVETQPIDFGSSTPDTVSINLAVAGQNVVNFGDTPCGLEIWNTGERGGTAAGKGTATENNDLFLREGDSFLVWAEKTLEVPARPSLLRVPYTSLLFDTATTGRIKDAFEMALVDPATGRTLVFPYAADRDAAFNITEGLPAALGTGTTNPSGAVLFDLSGLSPGTQAKLIVRLVNNDTNRTAGTDVNTSVHVNCIDLVSTTATKFFVADDGTDTTYRYDTAGTALGNSPLLGANGAAASPRGAASNLAGTRVWVVDSAKTVWAYDTTGTPVGGWQATDAALTNPQGITTNGTDIWLIDAGSLKVYRYTNGASLTTGTATAASSFTLHSENTKPSDLVTDGTKIWVTDEGRDEVFVYNLAGALQGRWTLDSRNSNASGITLNPAGGTDLWVVDRQDSTVYQYATGRTQLSGGLTATATFALAAGQGRPEGIADPPPPPPGESIGDRVWVDTDSDGIQDAGESGLSLVTVKLYDAIGALLGTTTTNSTGNYSFSVTGGANYKLEFVLPYSYAHSPKDVGVDDTADSDADPVSGFTAYYFIPTSTNNVTVDAGMFPITPPPSTDPSTDFWFTIPSGSSGGADGISITAAQDTNGTVSVPGQSSSQSFFVAAGTIVQVPFGPFGPAIRLTTADGIENRAIHVTSENPVVVYVENNLGPDQDRYPVQPTERLGTDHIVVAYGGNGSQFAVAASADNTVVTITPSATVNGHLVGVPYTVTLNQGQAYELRNDVQNSADLTGTIVSADKPIAVFGGNGSGNLAEQLPTITGWGKRFITAPIADNPGGDLFRIMAAEDGTAISINGVQVAVLQRGQFHEATLDDPAEIVGDRPILVAQYADGDPSMMLVPAVDQTTNAYIWEGAHLRTIADPDIYYAEYVNILAPDADVGNITLNGGTIEPGLFVAVGSSGYSVAQVLTNPVNTIEPYKLAGLLPFGAIAYTVQPASGGSNEGSYGYPLGLIPLTLVGPTIEVIDPAEGTAFPVGSFQTISGLVTPGSGAIASVTINGVPVDAFDSTGNFFTQVQIASGINSYTFTALDANDLVASATLTLTGVSADTPSQNLVDVTPSLSPTYARTSWDERVDVVYAELSVQNTGQYRVNTPIRIVIGNLSDPTVLVHNPDGFTADGHPYFDFSSVMSAAFLAPGQSTPALTLQFFNPNGVQFTYDLAFLSTLNQAPRITSVPVIEAVATRLFSYDASATDADGDPIAFDLIAAPAGMTINSSTGLINWTPATGDVGMHDVVLRVQDGQGGADEQRFTLSVIAVPPNRPPVFTSVPAADAIVDVPYTEVATATDIDGDTVTFSLPNPLAGMSINPQTGAFTWTPVSSQAGVQTVTVNISDGQGGSALLQLTICVLPPAENHRPIIVTTPTTAILANQTFTYTAQALDPDGDALTYSLPTKPTGTSFDPVTGQITWNTAGFPANPYPFELDVTDGHGWIVTQSFSVNVISAAPGQITGLVFNDVDGDGQYDGSVNEPGLSGRSVFLDRNQNYRIDPSEPFATTDSNGIYSLPNLAAGPHSVMLAPVSGRVTTTPANATHTVTLATGGTSANRDFGSYAPLVTPENQSPTFTTSPITAASVGALYRYEARAADSNGDPLTFDLSLAPAGMTIDALSGVVVWEPRADQVKTHDVILRVHDDRGGVALQAYQIVVPIPNTAPVITSSPGLNAISNLPYVYQVRAQDAEAHTLTYSFSGPSGMQIDSATGLLSWTPIGSYPNPVPVTVTVNDGHGGIATQQFSIVVAATAPNKQPVISSAAPTKVQLGSHYVYFVRVTDADSDPLTYSFTPGLFPAGMTINSLGRIDWQPTTPGNNLVEVKVTDGRGGIAYQAFTISVLSKLGDQAPTIVSSPPLSAVTTRPYVYDLKATDPENEAIFWSLDTAPAGMSIDPQFGTLRWTPLSTHDGPQDIVIRATDVRGLSATQAYTLDVQGCNIAPVITSVPVTNAAVGVRYFYPVRAIDANKDPLIFTLVTPPNFMTINSTTGLLRYDPATAGTVTVTIRVSDGQGATAEQSFDLVVAATPPNRPPAITSRPPLVARVGFAYTYDVDAKDPDGDTLTCAFEIPPTPPGDMQINSSTGVITWTPTVGVFTIAVVVTDTAGKQARQRWVITSTVNQAPTITSTAVTAETAGRLYRYDVRATDPNGDRLAWTLDQTSLDRGMTVDQFGRIVWKTPVKLPTDPPTVYPVTVTATDPYGEFATQSYNLTLSADNLAPTLKLVHDPIVYLNLDPVDDGKFYGNFVLKADDNVGIATYRLTLQGPGTGGPSFDVPIDRNGFGRYLFDTEGTYAITASVTDAAGNQTTVTSSMQVINILNNLPPVVIITTPTAGAQITAPINVVGSVSDPELGSVSWTLKLIPFGEGQTRLITMGSGPISGILGQLDPTLLANGNYTLRLEANDGIWIKSSERTIAVAGNLKLGNFTLDFTDLTVPVSGIPITVRRSYDTLQADSSNDLGYGWRLNFGDPKLEVTLDPEAGTGWGGYPIFKDGTRVTLTSPDGETQGFTFAPIQDTTFFGTFYHPYFAPDSDTIAYLEVKDFALSRTADGEYFSYDESGLHSYNPADPAYGGKYTLHTIDLLKQDIDATTGKLMSISNLNGNTVTFKDNEIVANTGRKVTIERDAKGRITKVTDPRGNGVRYAYDAAGNLKTVTDRLDNATEFAYRTDRPHYLDKVVDPFGRTGVKTDFNSEGRLSQLKDAQDKTIGLVHDINARTETITDQLGHPATVKFDTRGNVTETVDQVGTTTQMTYQPGTPFPLSKTDVIGTPGGGDDLTTTFTVDPQGRPLTETDPLGNMTQTTYSDLGLPATMTDSLGNTTATQYDTKGNLTQVSAPSSEASALTYFADGNMKTMAVGSSITQFEYNVNGDRTATVSPFGIRRDSTYDENGNNTGSTESFTGGTISLVAHTNTFDAADRNTISAKVVTENSIPRTYWDTSRTFDILGQIVSEIDQNDNLSDSTYDSRGQAIESRRQVKDENNVNVWLASRIVYDAAGRTTYSTDPYIVGSTRPITGTHTVYDNAGQVTQTEMLEGLAINISGAGSSLTSVLGSAGTVLSSSSTTYDSSGRVVNSVDQYGRQTQTTYDRFGRTTQTRTQSANANGTAAWLISRTLYDSLGRAYITTDSYVEGSATAIYGTRSVFDYLGRASKTERLQGVVVNLDSLTGNTTLSTAGTVISSSQTVFDSKGRTALTVGATGQVTRFEYDAFGRQTAVISHAILEGSTWVSNRTETEFDTHGRRSLERSNVRAVWSANPNSATSTATFTRDASLARETHFDYDVFGNLKKTTFADNSFATATFDDFGRKIAETDAVNQTTNFEYDAQSRLKAVVQPGVINPATGLTVQPRTEYGYDAYGNQVTIKDALNHVTTFGFDAHNRQTSRTLPLVTPEPTPMESMAYNAKGDLDYTLDFKGQKADYVYDYEIANDTDLGLLRRVDYYNTGANTPTETVGYTYDPFGRRDVVTETLSGTPRVTDTDYDLEGRVTRVLNADGEIHYGYNLLGQQTQMWTGTSTTFAGGTTGIEYEYDPFGRRALVRESRRNNATLATPLETRYTFDRLGNVTKIAVTEGATTLRETNNTYDPTRFWLSTVENKMLGVVQSSFNYTRRVNGQITQVIETLVKQPDATTIGTTNVYTYDALNRLTNENVSTSPTTSSYVKSYTLDLVGNRTRLTYTPQGQQPIVTNSAYDNRDRLLTETTGATIVNFGYDANGSLTSRNGGGSTLTQTWDLRNRLSGAVANGVTTAYKYTADGIRSTVTEGGTTTKYVIDSMSPSGYAQVVEELASGVLVVSYVYGAGLDPISMNRDTNGSPPSLESSLFLADGHSGVRQALTAIGGAILAAYRFDAFGNKMASAGTLVNPIGYRGERFDATLGQYYLRARFYDPRVGRADRPDLFAGLLPQPWTLHRYSFAHNDPINFTDPSGLAEFSFAGITVQINTRISFGSFAAFRASIRLMAIEVMAQLPQIMFLAEALGLAAALAVLGIGVGLDAIPDDYDNPNHGTNKPVVAYEVDEYDDLYKRAKANGQTGQFRIHHVPAKGLAHEVLDGYSAPPSKKEPCMVVPIAEHTNITRAEFATNQDRLSTPSPTDLVSRDFYHLRKFTSAPMTQLRNLAGMLKGRYPSLFRIK